MANDDLDCNIESILGCQDSVEFEVLQRLSAFCLDVYSKSASFVETFLANEKNYEETQESISEEIVQSYKIKKDKMVERDEIILQQKVTDKKIAITKSQQIKLEEEIHDAKLKKESISLEMVDLMQEIDEARKHRKEQWNAIKLACSYYKENLDIHVGLEHFNDYDKVKVTFFQSQVPERDNYYVILENHQNKWRVGQIEPSVKDAHVEKIKTRVDWAEPLSLIDASAFLCLLRKIFLKHYIKE